MNDFIDYVEMDDKKYAVVKEIYDNDKKYVLFANLEDVNDVFVRRCVIDDDGEEYLIGLDNQDEFDKVMLLFTKEMK